MTQETLMTTEAANTTEADAAAQTTTETTTAVDEGGQQQQATQDQGADSDKAAETKTEGDQDKPQGAPEKYEFSAPEGGKFDDAVIEQFSEVAKELNLSQEAAQKVLDKMAPVIAGRQVEQLQAVRAEWAESSKVDKEFGGEKLPENLAVAKKGLETFASPELRTLLNETGLGNHPEVIRMFWKAGQAISEDSFVNGKKGASSSESTAQRMYPNMNP